MMSTLRYVILSATVLLGASVPATATAATFERLCYRHPGDIADTCVIAMKGEITPGDTGRLAEFGARPENADLALARSIYLQSPGGDVGEALRLAAFFRDKYVSATVPVGWPCASACFLVWLGAPQRVASNVGGAKIGLHRPYFQDAAYRGGTPESLAKAQAGAMQAVRAFLQEQNLSQRLIDEMMRRPSNDVYWLTPADIREIGDYAPWLEEVLIRECNHGNPQERAMRSNPAMTREDFRRILMPVIRCTGRLLGERRERIPLGPS